MAKVLIISFDAVGDTQFDWLMEYPNFSMFMKEAAVTHNVSSVYLSNTYPIHASVVTGVPPAAHGLISNVEPKPVAHPVWQSDARKISSKTLWQAAHQKGLTTAAVMWPVTAHAKEITYNIAEVMARPGQSQLVTSLKAGSKLTQTRLFLKYRHLLDGLRQPNLDNFASTCMADLIKTKNPDLMLLHLTCYDTMCHMYGPDRQSLAPALLSLDQSLGKMMAAVGPDTTVLLFSDHSQLPVHTIINPNTLLRDQGFLEMDPEGGVTECRCFIECCGGSAFFHQKDLPADEIPRIKTLLEQSAGFARFLTAEELFECGRKELAFGFCAQEGFCYETMITAKKGNHGYPLDYQNYKVFYAVHGNDFQNIPDAFGGSLLDLAPLVSQILSLDMPISKGELL